MIDVDLKKTHDLKIEEEEVKSEKKELLAAEDLIKKEQYD
jgi:hypothetical protein